MSVLVPAGVRVQVRADRPAGVIRAYFAADDGSYRHEVGTLCIHLADDDRAAFDAWVKCLGLALNRLVSRATGVPLDDIESRSVRLSPEDN